MRFLTYEQSRDWAAALGFMDRGDGVPRHIANREFAISIAVPESFSRLGYLAGCLERALRPRDHLLIWVTDWGVHSNQNNHLYYRLRQSYGDHHLLDESPGHLCLDYEERDAATWIQLFLAYGWDFYLLPSSGYGRAFVSREGSVYLDADEPRENFERMRKLVAEGNFAVTSLGESGAVLKPLAPDRK